MPNVWLKGLFVSLFLLVSTLGAKADNDTQQLIDQYLHDDQSCVSHINCVSPYFFQIAEKGPGAVGPLLDALKNQDELYAQHHPDFLILLGMIGDNRAFPVLRDLFLEKNMIDDDSQQQWHQWELALFLGVCLNDANVDEFVRLVVEDPSGGALRMLKEMTGQDFEQDKDQWVEYLRSKDHLSDFQNRCRQRSKPY